MTKEKLKEDLEKANVLHLDYSEGNGTRIDKKEAIDFFYSKLQEIRKEEDNKIARCILKVKDEFSQGEWTTDAEGEDIYIPDRVDDALVKLSDLIKQDNETIRN